MTEDNSCSVSNIETEAIPLSSPIILAHPRGVSI
jgi:hypothetical protein